MVKVLKIKCFNTAKRLCESQKKRSCWCNSRGVQFFKIRTAYLKRRFKLKNLGGLFGTALLGRIRFFATGWLGARVFLGAAICTSGYLNGFATMRLACIVGNKKEDRGFPQTITINLLHAHSHGSTEQCRHPKPNERFMNVRNHFLKTRLQR